MQRSCLNRIIEEGDIPAETWMRWESEPHRYHAGGMCAKHRENKYKPLEVAIGLGLNKTSEAKWPE